MAGCPVLKWSPIKGTLFVKEDNDTIRKLADLNGKKLAIVAGYATIEAVKNKFPNIEIVTTDDIDDSINRVLNGQVAALYDSKISVDRKVNDELITGLKEHEQFSFEAQGIHLLSRIDQPLLQVILQKGLDAIPQQEKDDIIQDWGGVSAIDSERFTDKEQAWIDNKTPIHYVSDVHWPPFEWTNDIGQHSGMIADILSLIKTNSGLNLIHTKTNSWEQATQFAKERTVDMYSAVGVTEERKSYMDFSKKTILSTSYVFVSRNDEDFSSGFNGIDNTDSVTKLALVNNSTIHGIMNKEQPGRSLVLLKAIEEGLGKLLSNDIDVFLVNKVTAKYFIDQERYKKLKIAYQTDYKLNLHLAVRNDWPPEVLSIINN